MNWIIKQIKGLYHLFTKPAVSIGLGVLVAGGFIAGIIFWNAFEKGLEVTNTEEFCFSCHTMQQNYAELQEDTIHWKNRSGVRAYCADCHVPHEFTDKIARKMQASREVLAHIMGDIGTKEKFEEKRIVLAQREWDRLNANSSKQCRTCHDYKHMDFDKMSVMAQMEMRGAAERNTSCIECHKGIAHHLPKAKTLRNPELEKLTAAVQRESVAPNNHYFNLFPQDLFEGADLSKKIGSLETATAVNVLEQKGDAQKIELTLWRKNKGYRRVWYTDFGLNIMSAILEKAVSQQENFANVLETKEDPLTGLEWQKVTAQAWVKKGGLTKDLQPLWAVARNSYTASCSVCHVQPEIAHHDTNTWPGLFAGMVGFTNMDTDTAKTVLKYLQFHSSDFAQHE